MSQPILNPTKLEYPYETYTDVYNFILKSGKQKKDRVEMQFLTHKKPVYFGGNGEATLVEWIFDMQFLKSKCFDEANNLPYRMDEEMLNQAYYAIPYIDQIGLHQVSRWIKNIADSEFKRLK